MPPTPILASAQPFDPSELEPIRRLAYNLYEQRGRGEGHDLDDWLQAEAALNLQAFLAEIYSTASEAEFSST